MREDKFPYPVNLRWSRTLETARAWNEVCAEAMELFGLPGDRYITDVNINDMTWWFRDQRDAIIMTLKFSEYLCA